MIWRYLLIVRRKILGKIQIKKNSDEEDSNEEEDSDEKQ